VPTDIAWNQAYIGKPYLFVFLIFFCLFSREDTPGSSGKGKKASGWFAPAGGADHPGSKWHFCHDSLKKATDRERVITGRQETSSLMVRSLAVERFFLEIYLNDGWRPNDE